jgi:hypothetical protein
MKVRTAILLSAWAWSAMAAATTSPLPFIADDYDRARAEADRRHLPLFVEVWAPW